MANKCTYIDGIASSQAIDTAGEIVDIAGLDCSSLLGAAFNWEHKSDVPAQIVGKVLDFKKIFSEKDCDTDRQRHYWSKVNMPFLYVMGRLLDDKKESAKEVAGLMLDDAQNPHEPQMLGFSIEGAKIHKEGMKITRSIARKVTITNMPANKSCIAEMVPFKKAPKNDIDSLFKGEIEFFNPNANYLELLEKKEKEMKKDVGTGGGAFIGDSLAMGELAKSAPSWTHTGGGNFSHPEHGIVSVTKHPTGEFHVKHNGSLAGVGGKKGVFGSAAEAGSHAGEYMRGISSGKVMGPKMHNRPSPQMPTMNKALEVGSGNVAPGELTQGAALGKEDLEKGITGHERGVHLPTGDKRNPGTSTMGTHIRKPTPGYSKEAAKIHANVTLREMKNIKPKLVKSEWLNRAEEAYNTWEKREQFENYMAKKMPHLTKGEIKAIGQTLALKKSIEAEGKLSKMVGSFYSKKEMDKTTDIMMANEKKK